MQAVDPNKRDIEESYTSATAASNLTVKSERRGDADLLIAAAWSKSRIGAALLRLHSEWDGAEKPKKPTNAQIEALAATFARDQDGNTAVHIGDKLTAVRPIVAARWRANEWHQHELRLLFQHLKTLPEVRLQLTMKATIWQMPMPDDVTAAVLRWWLDPTCPACEGRRWQVVPGTGRLSDKPCPACHGTGVQVVPYGGNGRRLANFMDECTGDARASIRNRLRNMTGRR